MTHGGLRLKQALTSSGRELQVRAEGCNITLPQSGYSSEQSRGTVAYYGACFSFLEYIAKFGYCPSNFFF